jgi:Tfp pilus assembly protein PilN
MQRTWRQSLADPSHGDPAEKRLWLLTGARLLGVAIAFLGLWLFATQRQVPGAVLMLGGVAAVALLPGLLLRRWRR